jgi:predicted RNA-binding protein YlqC (UPF0109 family)
MAFQAFWRERAALQADRLGGCLNSDTPDTCAHQALANDYWNATVEGELKMNPTPTQMDELVSQIAQSLVDRPQDVVVNAIEGNHTTVLELRVAKEDIGKVIGRQGRTAQAIRTLIGAVSAKIKKRAVLEIVE